MKPQELLFWIVVGLLVSVLILLFTNQLITNMVQAQVSFVSSSKASSGGTSTPNCGSTCKSQFGSSSTGTCEAGTTTTSNGFYGIDDLYSAPTLNEQFYNQPDYMTQTGHALDTLQQNKINTVDALIMWDGLNGITSIYNSNTNMDSLTRLSTYLHQRGMLLGLQPSAFAWGTDWSAEAQSVINNINGKQDQWIQDGVQAINTINPDLINVYSEPDPPGYNSPSGIDSQTMSNYISFLTRTINTWQAAKPGLTVAVMSIPNWNLNALVDSLSSRGVTFPSNVIIAMHFYYDYQGTDPNTDTSNWGYGVRWQEDYWNGNFANAKQELYSYLLNDFGIQDALNHGYKLWFEALGTSTNAQNGDVFLRDIIAFANQYGISYTTSGCQGGTGWNCNEGTPPWILNAGTFTLNTDGQILTSSIPTSSSTASTSNCQSTVPIDTNICSSGTCCCS